MVAEQLQRDGRQDRRDIARVAIHLDDDVVGVGLELRAAMGEDVEPAAARLDFLHVGMQFFQQLVVGRDHDHRHLGVDQRQRTVLEFAGGVGLGVDVGNFLELQRALHRDRVVLAAAEEQRVLLVDEILGDRLDLRLESHQSIYLRGKRI